MTNTYLVEAAKAGNLAQVCERLEAGDDIEEKDGECTPLIWAAANGHTEVARLLVEHGANLAAKSPKGNNPLALAQLNGHEATAAFLSTAVQQPLKPLNPERWVVAGPSSVAYVGLYPALEQKLTHIFNFEMRERVVTSRNLRTGADTLLPPESFDDLPQQTVEKALDAFTREGGKADRDYVLRGTSNIGKQRKGPNLESPA